MQIKKKNPNKVDIKDFFQDRGGNMKAWSSATTQSKHEELNTTHCCFSDDPSHMSASSMFHSEKSKRKMHNYINKLLRASPSISSRKTQQQEENIWCLNLKQHIEINVKMWNKRKKRLIINKVHKRRIHGLAAETVNAAQASST